MKSSLEQVTEELAPYLTTYAAPDPKEVAAEALTMDTLRTTVESVLRDKFGGRYLVASDVGDLQTAVRAVLKKKYPKAVVTLKPAKPSGFSIEVDNL